MIKKYIEFLNESQKHPIQGRNIDTKDLNKYDPDSEEFLKAFHKFHGNVEKEIHNQAGYYRQYQSNTNIPTIVFHNNAGSPEINYQWKENKNKLDNRSTQGYIMYMVDDGYFEDEESAAQHGKTMESYSVDVSEEVQKFCNRWGYEVYYTYVILKHSFNPLDSRLLVTFVKDPDLVKKHRGSIAGRKYDL